jgi:hypothetical protein
MPHNIRTVYGVEAAVSRENGYPLFQVLRCVSNGREPRPQGLGPGCSKADWYNTTIGGEMGIQLAVRIVSIMWSSYVPAFTLRRGRALRVRHALSIKEIQENSYVLGPVLGSCTHLRRR